MRMKPVDVAGSVYSSGGLRFGGFQTFDFLLATENLEKLCSGVIQEIVAEAHYLAFWQHRFPDFVFLLSAWWTRSAGLALLLAALGYCLELLRFFLLGPSRMIAVLSWLWGWLRLAAYPVAVVLTWSESKFLAVALAVFFGLQT